MHKIGIFYSENDLQANKQFSFEMLEKELSADRQLRFIKLDSSEKNEQEKQLKKSFNTHNLHAGLLLDDSFDNQFVANPNNSETLPLFKADIFPLAINSASNNDLAFEKAVRLIQIAIERARKSTPSPLIMRQFKKNVLIFGADKSALKAAFKLSEFGIKTILLKPELSATDKTDKELTSLLSKLSDSDLIEVHENACFKNMTGQLGDFFVTASCGGEAQSFNVGAVVVSSGSQYAAITDYPSFDANSFEPDKTKSICFWLDKTGFEPSNSHQKIMTAAISQVESGGKAYVIFKNLLLRGRAGQKLYDQARHLGVIFLRLNSDQPQITKEQDKYTIELNESSLPDKTFQFTADLLLVPPPVKPNQDNPQMAEILRQALDAEGFLQPGNIRSWPLASKRRGLYFIGQSQLDHQDSADFRFEADALAALLLSELKQDSVLSPVGRVSVNTGKCASCLTCLRMCPHGAIESYFGQRSVTFLDTACYQCGICAVACPGQAIEHHEFSYGQFQSSMSVAAKELSGKKPVIVFACEKSATPSLKNASELGLNIPDECIIIELPCAGRIDEATILQALEADAAGVLVLGCHHSVCKSLKGSDIAKARIKRVNDDLASLGVADKFVQFHTVANNEPHRIIHLLEDIAK